VTILGGGTNVLILDGGIRGLTIRLARALTDVKIVGTSVISDAGVLYPALANITAGRGLEGLEFATGIPGTVGGAVYMNAGAYGGETRDVLDWAEVYKPEVGAVERVPNANLELSYRRSVLHERPGWIALRAAYTLTSGDSEELKARIKEFRAKRINGTPSRPSCGSTFKRPKNDFPGRVIEEAGLKGTRVGQIEVSPVHANYFVNHGGGSATDALKLIEYVKEAVYKRLGVDLEMEVKVLGDP
jgi:UDP-N-acetylmuramate dehydrogenase